MSIVFVMCYVGLLLLNLLKDQYLTVLVRHYVVHYPNSYFGDFSLSGIPVLDHDQQMPFSFVQLEQMEK